MKPMTAKELEYVIDSLSNEDLLLKTTAYAASISTHPEVKNLCNSMVQTHQANYNTLLQSLQSHQSVAPIN